MKKIKYIIALFAYLALASSCQKELDLMPNQQLESSVALSSDANVKIVLVGAYRTIRYSGTYGGCLLRNSELLAGTGEISWQGTYNAPREIFNHTIISANGDVTAQWLQSYECINVCNNVLSALAVVNEDDREMVEGEALFLRSMMYFDLVRFYAQTYEAGVPNTQLGVPLVLTPTTSITPESYVSRNTVDEVYTQVIKDLLRSIAVLPEENGYYATSGAANALLARVYLQKGDFANARDAANRVIESGLYSLNSTYAAAFNNEEYTSEDIFSTKFTPADGINQMTEFFSTTEYGGRDGDIEILYGHLSLYQPDDDRLHLFWEGNDGIRSGKWNTMYGLVNLFRLSEMYLVRAECNRRLGTNVGDTPVNDYNRVHTRAGLPPAVAVTVDDITYERRLELADEGPKIHDMKRLHQSVGSLPYNSPKLVFPIPEREMTSNPGLAGQQNEGY